MNTKSRSLFIMGISVVAILMAIATARSAQAQKEPAVEAVKSEYDQFDDETTVSLSLAGLSRSNPEFRLRCFKSFKGRRPDGIPQQLTFFVEHPSSSYSSNVFLVDGERFDLGPIVDERIRIPIRIAAAIAAASRVEARVGGESFSFSAEHKAAFQDLISRVVPGGRYVLSDLDAPRSGGWSLERTLSYINGILRRYRRTSEDYEHLEYEDGSLTLYQFSERSQNTVAGYGDSERWRGRATDFEPLSAEYGSGVIFLECRDQRRCVSFHNRHAGDEWRYVNQQPDLQIRLRSGYAEAERVKNAVSYVAELVGGSSR